MINPTDKGLEEIEEGIKKGQPRARYTGMRAHQELAAQVLAVGGTQRLAAKYAGVSYRQIKKYYSSSDFRTRIEELRAVMASKIKGRIMNELSRRTDPKMIKNMELLDLLRVMDRLTVGGKGMAIQVSGDVNVNNYETILASLFAVNPGSDGENIPVYEPAGLLASGIGSSVDEEV